MNQSLPPAVREAALRYATQMGSADLALHLIESFGISEIGDEAHRRAVWLCVLAARKVIYGWQALECEGDGPGRAVEAAAQWAQTRFAPADWKPLATATPAIRNGRVINDCDICRAKPIALAAAATAKFASTAAPADAAEALFEVWCAIDEGIRRPNSMPFEQWIATLALPAAFELRELSERELRM